MASVALKLQSGRRCFRTIHQTKVSAGGKKRPGVEQKGLSRRRLAAYRIPQWPDCYGQKKQRRKKSGRSARLSITSPTFHWRQRSLGALNHRLIRHPGEGGGRWKSTAGNGSPPGGRVAGRRMRTDGRNEGASRVVGMRAGEGGVTSTGAAEHSEP